jgi:hypothetical protein
MEKKKSDKCGITRREFIQYSAAAGVALSMPGLFVQCSDSGGGTTGSDTEYRTYFFDLSHADPTHDFYMKAASQYLKLKRTDLETLQTARQSNPLLALVPDANITHYINSAPLPSKNICLCWIVDRDPSARDGSWSMALMFYHLPHSALRAAAQRPGASREPCANKFKRYGIAPSVVAGVPDALLLADDFKTWQDQAVALVFGHQELICGQADAAAHIQTNIISSQAKTGMLADVLQYQGPASESGGWATQEVYINPDTGQPYLNSQGQNQCFLNWSSMTLEAAGGAIQPCLQQAKDDATLGANITDLDPTQENAAVSGTIWKVQDGVTTVDAGSGGQAGDGTSAYTFADQSCDNGYRTTLEGVDANQNVTFQVHNWYGRYLAIFVRFLDANDNPIHVSDLPSSTTNCFPSWGKPFNGTYDSFALLLEPEWELLGIPIKSTTAEFTFNMPEIASKVLILASGSGSGDNSYPDTVGPGDICTAMINLGVPGLFLVLAIPTGFLQLVGGLQVMEVVRLVLDLIMEAVIDGWIAYSYRDPTVLAQIGKTLGEYLLGKAGAWLAAKIMTATDNAEALDSIPVIGNTLMAIAAAGLVAEIAETIAEICRSPRTYVGELTFTHNIGVTINHDPDDYEFPAVASYYEVKAFFDSGTPWDSGSIPMPGTSWSDPLTYTFQGVPYGGNVKIWVGFYSANDWLAGQGSTDNIPNDATAASVTITITENKAPLQINTVYSHREKTTLDANGNLIWEVADAPTATMADLNCGNQNGDLCELACITVSEYFAAAGYAWKSFSAGVAPCAGSGQAQLFQFAGMSIAQDPESGHATSGCGFSNLVRIVYDLMGSQNNNFYLDTTGGTNLVRQIRLSLNQKPDFDGPSSNKCWGSFSNPSDALLLHPSRKLISINSEYDKIEVLDLPDTALPDNEAPLAQVYSATGTREGLISGPICAAIAPNGAILVLEGNNLRIQAFDLGGNPAPYFGSNKDQYYVPLKQESSPVTYLDMAVEYVGYIYVLSCITQQGLYQYRMDIYTPEGAWLCRTTGVNADKMTVDFWRNAYTLNYETLKYPDGPLPSVTEPSVSQWMPSTP